MYIIFDTETTGFPKNKQAPYSDLDNWPRIVQIAWQVHNKKGELVKNVDHIIYPDGYTIPFNAQKVHGISTEIAQEHGIDIKQALEEFHADLKECEYVIGHNIIGFDNLIVGSECFRNEIEDVLSTKNCIDTITESTEFCAIPGGRGGGFKFPKLGELYEKLFNENFDFAHNAAADVNANARAFLEMLRRKIIPPEQAGLSEEDFDSFTQFNPQTIPVFDIEVTDRTSTSEEDSTLSDKKNTDGEIPTIIQENFFQFHNHTTFSVLTASTSPDDLVKKAIENNMPAVGIADFGNLMGAFHFIKSTEKMNAKKKAEDENYQPIIPIVGCEIYISEDYLTKKFTKDNPDRRYNQLLLAKNLKGFRQLSKISSIGFIDGLYAGYPRVSKEVIAQHKDNVIALTGGLQGMIPNLILNRGEEIAKEEFIWWKDTFGEDFYVEYQDHGLEEEQHVNKVLLEWAKEFGVKVLAQNESYYLQEEDSQIQDILICIRDGEKKSVPVGRGFGKRYGLPNHHFGFEDTATMFTKTKSIPFAMENFSDFLQQFEPYTLSRKVLLPKFDIPEAFKVENDLDGTKGENAYLRHLSYEGANKRYSEITEEITERLDFELGVIEQTGYPGYFLIVQDFTRKARELGVGVGPGRGSAAGSLVAYCTGITNVDPIKYDLLFERFLNPDRVSLPDIDIDFDDRGRDKIIEWVVNKYGKNQVAQIITYGTLAGRSAIRDAGRVLELPLFETDDLAKKLPSTLKLKDLQNKSIDDLKKSLRDDDLHNVQQLKKVLSETSPKKAVLEQAQRLEGNIRNTGIHACGVIITPEDLTELVPVSVSKDADLWVTQFDNAVVEDAGLLKMDFLGLRTLTIIQDAIDIIKERHGIEINVDDIPLDDELTYEKIFKPGNTVGIFQYESPGMQKHLKGLQPDKFDDLIAMNALYRPGPIKYIPNFIARKQGRETITYDLPEMEEYLKDTYGITVYQEQVMLLSQKLAGFTRGQADSLRKAMGKKQRHIIDEMFPLFLEGGKKQNFPEETLQKIWTDWEAFAEYAFNKSHSTCYALVAFHTAYLKAHYPAEYMAALLTNNINNLKSVSFFIEESKNMGIEVLGPDVNESKYRFFVNDQGKIRFGLGALKGVGKHSVLAIMEEREKNGNFTGIFDFMERIDLKNINKKVLESLAYSGAFDEFDSYHRGQYFQEVQQGTVIEHLMKYGSQFQTNKHSSQNSLFGDIGFEFEMVKPDIPNCDEWNVFAKLAKEKEVVGLYISSHPLDEFKFEYKALRPMELHDLESNQDKLVGKEITIAGRITKAEHRDTKDGKSKFAILHIEDYSGSMSFRIFGEVYLKYAHLFQDGLFVYGKVKVQHGYNQERVYINFTHLGQLKDALEKIQSLKIEIPIGALTEEMYQQLSLLIQENKGEKRVEFVLIDASEKTHLNLKSKKYKVNIAPELLQELDELEGLAFHLN